MVTKAKRASNNRWDKENMSVLTCKMRNETAASFRAACKLVGTTPNAVFRAAAEDLIERVKGGRFPTPGQQKEQEQGTGKGQV